jgi:hypothetical protein
LSELPVSQIRVGDDDRERVVGALHRHAQAGRLDPVELDERVEAALTARTFGELEALTRDLPRETAPAALVARRTALRKLGEHAGSWVAVSVICIAIWAATGADYFWPLWPMLGYGFTLILHAVSLLTNGPDRSRSEEPSH